MKLKFETSFSWVMTHHLNKHLYSAKSDLAPLIFSYTKLHCIFLGTLTFTFCVIQNFKRGNFARAVVDKNKVKMTWNTHKSGAASPGKCSSIQVCCCCCFCAWLWLWASVSPSSFAWFVAHCNNRQTDEGTPLSSTIKAILTYFFLQLSQKCYLFQTKSPGLYNVNVSLS